MTESVSLGSATGIWRQSSLRELETRWEVETIGSSCVHFLVNQGTWQALGREDVGERQLLASEDEPMGGFA